MVERSLVRRPFSLSSRSKFLKRDREGVASTVGTIMALLVFLTILTMFTNTYIPIWMKENERAHMDEVLTQFSDMKSKVDMLIINAQVTQKPTIDMYQPITMGSDAVPIFATATVGYMFLKPAGTYDTGVNVSFKYEYLNSTKTVNEEGGGAVEFYAPNRYYVGQWFNYENGALMVFQEEGMVMRATPSLVFTLNGDGTVNIQFDQVDIIGSNETISGQGSAGINIDLIYHDSQTYDVCTPAGTDNGQLVLKFTTRYNTVWESYINETAQAAGLLEGTNYTLSSTPQLGYDEYRPIYVLTLTINDVNEFTHNRAYVMMELEY
ncbi:MAG: hypothetical protein NT131_08300 [Methanomassiliicoccales archaeon]|nr:hypothetical protein [Methanomassiliicoccales archaeon]